MVRRLSGLSSSQLGPMKPPLMSVFFFQSGPFETKQNTPETKLNSKIVPVLPSPDPSLIIHFHFLPSPVHTTEFSFCFFPGLLAIFILLSSNNNNTIARSFRDSFLALGTNVTLHFYLNAWEQLDDESLLGKYI